MANVRIEIVLLLLFAVTLGTCKKEDYKNQTVECLFKQYSVCYNGISDLGGNLSARYADTAQKLNSTCKMNANNAIVCIQTIQCPESGGAQNKTNIGNFIHKLCTNNTAEQIAFLSSSTCYNANLVRRQNCVSKYSSGIKIDAKSLCCSNLKTQKCLRDEMNVCSKKDTDFQSKEVMSTYRSHLNYICKDYEKLCGHAVANAISFLTVFSSALIVFYNTLTFL